MISLEFSHFRLKWDEIMTHWYQPMVLIRDRGTSRIHGRPMWSKFWKRDPRDPRTVDLVRILKKGLQGSTDRRFGPNLKKRLQGSTEGRIGPNIERGITGIHWPPIWSKFLKGKNQKLFRNNFGRWLIWERLLVIFLYFDQQNINFTSNVWSFHWNKNMSCLQRI